MMVLCYVILHDSLVPMPPLIFNQDCLGMTLKLMSLHGTIKKITLKPIPSLLYMLQRMEIQKKLHCSNYIEVCKWTNYCTTDGPPTAPDNIIPKKRLSLYAPQSRSLALVLYTYRRCTLTRTTLTELWTRESSIASTTMACFKLRWKRIS